jgi:branched-chain amino acid transport system ATP-binding protein
MLEIADLDVEIHGSQILRNVRLSVGERELVCLVGRNGAGKSTTLKTVMGYLPPRKGSIRFRGRDLSAVPTRERAQLGMGYSPEDSEVFGELTVAENIELPTWTRKTARSSAERIDLAYNVFPTLKRYMSRGGMQLSGGERKMLSIARTLSLDAEFLLLDEPFEGLSPTIIPALRESIAEILSLGRTVLMAESELHHVPDFAHRIYLIERGEIVFSGSLAEARTDATVQRVIGAKF